MHLVFCGLWSVLLGLTFAPLSSPPSCAVLTIQVLSNHGEVPAVPRGVGRRTKWCTRTRALLLQLHHDWFENLLLHHLPVRVWLHDGRSFLPVLPQVIRCVRA
jgi:hypothetical protein